MKYDVLCYLCLGWGCEGREVIILLSASRAWTVSVKWSSIQFLRILHLCVKPMQQVLEEPPIVLLQQLFLLEQDIQAQNKPPKPLKIDTPNGLAPKLLLTCTTDILGISFPDKGKVWQSCWSECCAFVDANCRDVQENSQNKFCSQAKPARDPYSLSLNTTLPEILSNKSSLDWRSI